MKIKKYIIALLSPLLLFMAESCKDFLQVEPQGKLTEVQALQDPDAADKLVAGVYNTLYYGGFDKTTVGFLYAISLDMASDDTDKGSTPTDFGAGGEIDNFTHTPNNFIFNNIWNGYYAGITTANRAIDILEKSSIDAGVRDRLIGECKFIRGMYYFNLVRYFGGVPQVIRVPDPSEGNSDEFQTRAPAADIYNVIIADLQAAADILPLKGETQVGRATKGAAQSFLAKVYMYQKNWNKVLELTNAVIASNKYGLVQNYNFIFRERPVNGDGGNNNIESIFEVQTGLNTAENAVSPLYSNGQGARSKGGWNDLGFGLNTPTASLANAFEANDTRRAASIIFIQPTLPGVNNPLNRGTILWDGFRIPTQDSVENQRYNYKVYHSYLLESKPVSENKDKKPKNIRLMRYAEVLLMNAEANANLGNGGEATAKLKLVRDRAGLVLSPLPGTIQNIWNERRFELAMEQDRFFDLVRQGRAGTVLRAHGKTNFVDGKNELFPIPQGQRALSGNRLTQNPGYN